MSERTVRIGQARSRVAAVALAVVFAALFGTIAQAQSWPAKPVRVILAIGAGSAVDISARLICDRLSRAFGQQFVVDNVPGASGILGAQAAARASPDGYTVFYGAASHLVSNAFTFKSIPYDPVRDFVPIAIIADSGPFTVSVHPEVPANTLAELIGHVKSNPGKLSYAVDVSSGYSIIVARWLTRATGLQIEEVSYKTMTQSVQDTVAGRTQVLVSSITAADAFVRAGKLRRLAVSSIRRFPTLEDLPTIAETVPGLQLEGWFVLVAPTGTPTPIIDRLNRELAVILKEPEIVQRLLAIGLATTGAGTPQAAGEFMRAERERWTRIVKEAGLEPQ